MLVTERLVISEATEHDVDGLLAVALSNPDFTGDHEGSGGEPGQYDRAMLERDLAVAWADPLRHPLVVRDTSDPATVIAWAEVLDEHPRDGLPWIGLLEVHAGRQRRGYGREVVAALVAWAGQQGAAALRLGVDDDNGAAYGFWLRSGFHPVDHRERVGPAGPVGVTVMETPVPAR
jgi:GNAT superfamily N-acetyltransferase